MPRNLFKQFFCILIAVFFIIGLLGSIDSAITVSWKPYSKAMRQNQLIESDNIPVTTDRLIPVETMKRIDDFQVTTATRRKSSNTEENADGTNLLFMAIVFILLLVAATFERGLCFGEKQIDIFHVITFIHRLDGKKRNPVLMKVNTSKQEVNESGNWN